MPARFTLRPGVFFEWIDQGISPTAISTSIGALVFPADRGPLKPVQITGYNKFVDRYGPNNYLRGYGHDTAKGFFRTAEAAVCLRVTGTGAKYGLAQVANNYIPTPVTVANPTGLAYEGTSVISIPGGSDVDYSLVNRTSVDLIFDKDIVANQSLKLTINTVDTTVVGFTADSHLQTLNAIAQSIQTVLDGIAVGGTAKVVSRTNGQSERIIRIISPHNVTLTVSNPVWSGTAAGTAPVVVIRATEWLQYVISENPGAWAGKIGIQFDGIDRGRVAEQTLTVAGPFASNHRFNITINGVNVTVPPNVTGSNAMMTDIATAINAQVPNVIASIDQVTGSNLNRVIRIKGANNNVDLNITAATVGLASGSTPTPPLVTRLEIVPRLVPTQDFTMSVYEYPDLRSPKDVYRGTFRKQVDASGQQVNLEYLVNSGPSRSTRVRLWVNPLAVQNNWTIQSNTKFDYYTGEGFLGGGANGVLPTSADVINGWSQFLDPISTTVRILMDCGYTTPEVHRYMNVVCETRRDCMGIISVPSSYQANIESIVDYRTRIAAIDSSYMAIYSTDINIYDTDSGEFRYTPPSGHVGAAWAYTDRTRREFWSPAGLTRGKIPEANMVRFNPAPGDQSTLAQYQVNAILNYKNQGIYIFNDYTMQYAASPLQFIGTRRMCNSIEVIASDTVAYSLFEPNNRATRNNVIRISEAILEDYKDAGGISRFKVVDETKNSDIDARAAKFVYIIDPVTSIHQIYITGIITRSGANFEEIIQARAQGGNLGSGVR